MHDLPDFDLDYLIILRILDDVPKRALKSTPSLNLTMPKNCRKRSARPRIRIAAAEQAFVSPAYARIGLNSDYGISWLLTWSISITLAACPSCLQNLVTLSMAVRRHCRQDAG
ncbi:hypothetical protein [Tardiphaga sp. 813_E8_N1_3]|uniref:hypothetical protein n=1 Tax=Tardiphaga sp. 813_E8_N1_3 TaxID=3240760 RepID=UPI003F27DA7D